MYALILDALDLAATIVMVGAAVWFTLVAAKARDRAEATLQQAQELAAVLDRRLADLIASQMEPEAGPQAYQFQNVAYRLEGDERASMDASGAEGLEPADRAIREAREARERARQLTSRVPDYMADPVRVCPSCGAVIEIEPEGLLVDPRGWASPRCPTCAEEMRWSEWDLVVRERFTVATMLGRIPSTPDKEDPDS